MSAIPGARGGGMAIGCALLTLAAVMSVPPAVSAADLAAMPAQPGPPPTPATALSGEPAAGFGAHTEADMIWASCSCDRDAGDAPGDDLGARRPLEILGANAVPICRHVGTKPLADSAATPSLGVCRATWLQVALTRRQSGGAANIVAWLTHGADSSGLGRRLLASCGCQPGAASDAPARQSRATTAPDPVPAGSAPQADPSLARRVAADLPPLEPAADSRDPAADPRATGCLPSIAQAGAGVVQASRTATGQ